jgi:hypothetical protein
VFFSRPKKGHPVHQMWHGPARSALFHGISHKSKFVIYQPLCEYCVSGYNSDPRCHKPFAAARIMYWTIYTTLHIIHAIHKPKFIVKKSEYFSQINQFISRMQNFISLNLKEKSMRHDFFF